MKQLLTIIMLLVIFGCKENNNKPDYYTYESKGSEIKGTITTDVLYFEDSDVLYFGNSDVLYFENSATSGDIITLEFSRDNILTISN